ncbi:MAG: DUF4870 domain-containing protein [Anaerolineae bacterium]
MTDKMNPEDSSVQRISRLASSAQPQQSMPEGDELVREYEDRYSKPKRESLRTAPRSYRSVSVSDSERKWTAVAHASAWLTLLGGFATFGVAVPFSIFIPLAIYLYYRKKSDYVAFHALQAFVLQLLGTVGALLLLSVGGTVWLLGLGLAVLSLLLIVGVVLLPVWGIVGIALLLAVALMPLAMLLYSTIAAIETLNGRDYRLPVVARWIDRQLAGGLLSVG